MEVQSESLMGGENTYDGRGKGLREKSPVRGETIRNPVGRMSKGLDNSPMREMFK